MSSPLPPPGNTTQDPLPTSTSAIYIYPTVLLIISILASLYMCRVISARRHTAAAQRDRDILARAAGHYHPFLGPAGHLKRPLLHEAWLSKEWETSEVGRPRWVDLAPVSLSIAHPDGSKDTPAPETRVSDDRPRFFSRFRRTPPSRPSPDPRPPELKDDVPPPLTLAQDDTLLPAFIIAMPSQQRRSVYKDPDDLPNWQDDLPDIVLGYAQVPPTVSPSPPVIVVRPPSGEQMV
ncbi:hypothetical protein FRB99_003406 [Tulasnella sp. 403]|nr:hypothetical protein FRB99_003406 [Tulasnella sp. 403]